LSGQRFGVECNLLIGRSQECDITVPVAGISRQHARFVLDAGHLSIEDLGSSNGTSVNGSMISATVELNHQDTIAIIDVVIKVKTSPADSHARDATILQSSTLQFKTETRRT
jgi:pSer/pThr/pTyr-binding forkhead associated (FHA) protein